MNSQQRQVIPLNEAFFNDGYWYVLSSKSLGGSGLNAQQISDKLQTQDEAVIQQLLNDGICFPLVFPGDCALDQAVIIIGDLTAKEEQEWLGRMQSKLEIPCGEFLFMGGGMPEHFEEASSDKPCDPNFCFFKK